MSEILEIIMVISFGFSWPINAVKAYKAGTAKSQSLPFYCLIFFGYICGIISKLIAPSFKWYVLFFYILNMCMVGILILIYFRNTKLDKVRENKK